jgi:alpha-galactosidase
LLTKIKYLFAYLQLGNKMALSMIVISVVVVLMIIHETIAITIRLPTPLMGWSTWETYRKNVSEDKILANAKILKDHGLQASGYRMIQIDDGWQTLNRGNGWISRENYINIPTTRGNKGMPSFGSVAPGCIIPDPAKFPRGLKALGADLKSRGFNIGMYTSGEDTVCDSQPGFKGFYASSPYRGLREIDAKCFVDWGADLIKVDSCNPGTFALSHSEDTMRAWRRLLPDNIILYNSRYGCLARTTCGGPNSVYNCPFSINFARNSAVDSYCASTSDLARLGGDMRAQWGNIMTGVNQRIGRGRVSRPGFWSDPDYLVPDESKLTFQEIRSQFSVWCIVSAPLLISADLTKASSTVLNMLKNEDALRVNQQYYNNGGDLFTRSGVIWVFRKPLSPTENALLLLHVSAPYARAQRGPKGEVASWQLSNLNAFTNVTNHSPTNCKMKNIWNNTVSTLQPGTTFTLKARDCIFLLISSCD